MKNSSFLKTKIHLFFILIFFIGMAFGLHFKSFSLWWTFDDPYILEFAILKSPFSFFWNHDVYQQFSIANFTPFLAFSYALDYALFGFDPRGFYAHQVMLLGAIAFGIFLLIRQRNFYAAIAAGMVFLLSAPTTSCSQLLMTRHYLEGGMWAIIAVLLFISAENPGIKTWLAGSAYLISILCKEVYIPIFLIFPFFCQGSWKHKCQMNLPFWISVIVYIPWRFYMLRGFGGYGNSAIDLQAFFFLMSNGSKNMLKMLWSDPLWSHASIVTLFILIMMGVGIVIQVRNGYYLTGVIMLLIGSFGGILPLWPTLNAKDFVSYRLLFHISIVWAVGFGYCISKITDNVNTVFKFKSKVLLSVIVFGLLGAMWHGKQVLADQQWTMFQLNSLENKFVYNETENETLVVQGLGGRYCQALYTIRKFLHPKQMATLSVCHMPFDFREKFSTRYFRWSPEHQDFMDITEQCRNEINKFKERIIPYDFSFSLKITTTKGGFSFQVEDGTHDGEYYLLFGNNSEIYLRTRIQRLFKENVSVSSHPYYVRIIKKTPDNKYILSPEWKITLDENRYIFWDGGRT